MMHDCLLLLGLTLLVLGTASQSSAQDTPIAPAPAQMTAQDDHKRMMDLLHISELRPGRNGSNPQAANYANYDETKANPYPKLPDPLVLKSGAKVKSAKDWWEKRRPEIVEDFDREVYGRVPKDMPKVRWEVAN